MATIDLTDNEQFSETKITSVSSATLDKDDFNKDDTDASRDWVTLFRLPENCVVTALRVSVVEQGNEGDMLSLRSDNYSQPLVPGTASNSGEADIGTLKGAVRSSSDNYVPFDTGTGKKISVKANKKITKGKFVVIVEYVRYTVKDGTLNAYTPWKRGIARE